MTVEEKRYLTALCIDDVMQKSRALPVGTVKNWKGKEYVKVAPGKWRLKRKRATKAADDKEYFAAIKSGDIEAVSKMVAQKAEEKGFKDAIPAHAMGYTIRTTKPPKKTKKVYKTFFVDTQGKPSALFIGNNENIPMNVWVNANDAFHFQADNGKEYVPTMPNPNNEGANKTGISVKIPSPEVKQKLVEQGFITEKANTVTCVAYRPGWHAGDLPFFPQGGKKDKNSNYGNVHRWNQVVFECEIDCDNDYTQEAQSQDKARNKDGSINLRNADLQKMPNNGFYSYTTNPTVKQQTNGKGDWFISGSIKILRAMTEDECNSILKENNAKPQEWEGGSMDLSKLGYTGATLDAMRKTLAPITYDDNGNIIPLSQRFDRNSNDVRKSISVEESMQKSNDPKFEYFKKKVLEHLEMLEKKENEEKKDIKKSLLEAESIAKGGKGLPVGTIRTWHAKNGETYRIMKMAPGKWRKVYNQESRGAKMALAALKRKASQCTNSEELLDLILENKGRFSDDNGRPLPFVKELSEYVSQLNDKMEGTETPAKTSEKTKTTGLNFTSDRMSNNEKAYKATKNGIIYTVAKDNTGKWVTRVYKDKVTPYSLLSETKSTSLEEAKEVADNYNPNAKQEEAKKEEPKKEVKEDPKQEHYKKLDAKINELAEKYKNDSWTTYNANDKVKRCGEKTLKEFAEMDLKSDKEYMSDLMQKVIKLEEKTGKEADEGSIDYAIANHFYRVKVKELAQEKLDLMNKNNSDKADDIPVDPKDMDEAKNIIGSDVSAIINGRDTYGNKKQTLVDKIRRRVRNEPAIARAMLMYVKQQQEETGKVVFTPRNSIWDFLPQLNENARQAKENNETETKTGTSGVLYQNEDGSINVVENKDWGRYQITFPGKPSSDTIAMLKHRGFRWSPKTKTWVCYNSANGEYSLKQVVKELGLTAPKEEESEAEKRENRSEAMKGNKNAYKGVSDIRKEYQAAKSTTGNKKTITLPNGEKLKCHYKLVEAETPTASHNEETYAPTEGFPTTDDGKSINDRDYQNDKDAQESVRKIANNFNSLALDSPPIVTKDGIVVSGNNRTMSSKLAAKNGTDKEYLASLKDQIDEYGLEEEDLAGYKNPRLVLELDNEHEGDYTTEEFARFNQDTKKTMNNVEKAVKLTKTLNSEKISSIAETLTTYDTMSDLYQDYKGCQLFVDKLVKAGIIGENEKAQYLTSDGILNDTGKDFTETVLVGSVLNEDNIRKLDTPGGKRIRQKLVRAILPLIENKGTGKEYSFNNELNKAVDIAINTVKNHDKFKNVNEYLSQGDLFDNKKPDAVTSKLAEIIHDEGEKAFAQRMKDLGAGLQSSANGEQDIFLSGVESKDSLMKRFLGLQKSISNILSSLFEKKEKPKCIDTAISEILEEIN